MAIYRPPRPRWPAIVAAAGIGLLLGIALGWALGSSGGSDPVEALAEVRTSLSSASDLLDVAEIEYTEAVVDGVVVKEAELSGARGAVERSRERYEEVSEAAALMDPDAAASIDEAYTEILALMDAPADAPEVSAALEELAGLLDRF